MYDWINRVTRQVALGADTAHYFCENVNRTHQFKDPKTNLYSMQRNAAGWTIALLAATQLALVACGGGSSTATAPIEEDTSFAGPFAVAITGYDDHAMEPFITRDGQHLLFNNRNDPAELTDLHIAARVNDSTFTYLFPLTTLNSATLDGVPAGTATGMTYFVSVRAYDATFSTIHRATLTGATAGAPALVTSITTGGGGLLDFDVDVAADGQSLMVARGQFGGGGGIPSAANFVLYEAVGAGFARSAASAATLAAINTGGLNYAASTTANGLELCFTRIGAANGGQPVILVSRRATAASPWGTPQRVRGPIGFVEAGAWSLDARSLYYHALVGGRFVIRRLTRD